MEQITSAYVDFDTLPPGMTYQEAWELNKPPTEQLQELEDKIKHSKLYEGTILAFIERQGYAGKYRQIAIALADQLEKRADIEGRWKAINWRYQPEWTPTFNEWQAMPENANGRIQAPTLHELLDKAEALIKGGE